LGRAGKITAYRLILAVSLFLVLFDNVSFFRHVIAVFPVSAQNIGFLISLFVGLTAFIVLLFALVASRFTTKPVLILALLTSAIAAHFMDHYGIVIDHGMVKNVFQTNVDEATDLISLPLVLYFLIMGVLPAIGVYLAPVKYGTLKMALIAKLKVIAICLLIVVAMILVFGRFYTSFFRMHKPLRFYTNPTYYVYSLGRYFEERYSHPVTTVRPIGEDATIASSDKQRELIILVVGEAAREDHFSLNGYKRDTNPRLAKLNVISFTDFYSSGTSTAASIPCMFSVYTRTDCTDRNEESTENLLDVLRHAGVNVLWRDNNSSSKGVAARVPYQDFKIPANNPVCDVECRDVGMLSGLQAYIDKHRGGDIFIVLHQMGNHGPAYYKRYPPSFRRWTPVCKSNQLNECSRGEIINAYDNAILYTDYFLSRVIDLLQKNSGQFETAMLYMSDHGESLGEGGIYLHGLPYFLAPDVQKHIPAIMWFGKGFPVDRKALKAKTDKPFSHDNLFHTVLGMLQIRTSVYDKKLDILSDGG
jgi:lipid A ethanolaminephosphotransferase